VAGAIRRLTRASIAMAVAISRMIGAEALPQKVRFGPLPKKVLACLKRKVGYLVPISIAISGCDNKSPPSPVDIPAPVFAPRYGTWAGP
jgi:hypothetical protein